jgi:MraZ protein
MRVFARWAYAHSLDRNREKRLLTPTPTRVYHGTTVPHFFPLCTTHRMGPNFIGQYEHQMDEKGRVSLPSAFRKEAEGDRFVLLQWEKPYLTLFPISKWEEVQQRLLEYRRTDQEGWNHVRAVVSGAVEVSSDKQGRILVPAPLQQAAGLSGPVLMVGNIDRVELWRPETYRSVVQEAAGDLSKYSHRLFS